jgi:hypothetical protein
VSDFKLLPLTRGQFAIVDAKDFDWLNQWRWYAWRSSGEADRFYARRRIRMDDGSVYAIAMHNLILETEVGFVGDHWNGCTLDNRRCNLRQITKKQNSLNRNGSLDRSNAPPVPEYEIPLEFQRPLSVRNSTGFENIFRMKTKWGARIVLRGKTFYLGIYDTPEEAAEVYAKAKDEAEKNPRYKPPQKPSSRNTSGHKGISWHIASNKWRVTTTITEPDGTRLHLHLGAFSTLREAIRVRRKFVKEREKETLAGGG